MSTTLPTTAYIKLVDVWMIFTMMCPFAAVTLVTVKEVISKRMRLEKTKHHGTFPSCLYALILLKVFVVSQTKSSQEKCKYLAKICYPSCLQPL